MYVPQINTKGIFKLTNPFNDKLTAKVPYSCISVRSIQDMLLSKIDVVKSIYIDNGLTKQDYENDLKNGVLIVTLRSDTGKTVVVPASYIAGYPQLGGVPYVPFILGVNLGNLPKNIDISLLKDKINSVVMEYLGVASQCQLVVSGEEQILTDNEHAQIESQRQQNIVAKKTDYAKLLEMTAERDRLLQECTMYKDYIKAKLPHP